MSREEANQNFLSSNGKKKGPSKEKYIVSCTISVLRLWHSYRFSNPFAERMTHLFAANSCGERRHTTLPADPTSPALPVASASKPSQELEARGNSGPGAASPDPAGGRRGTWRGPGDEAPGGRLQPAPEEGKVGTRSASRRRERQ